MAVVVLAAGVVAALASGCGGGGDGGLEAGRTQPAGTEVRPADTATSESGGGALCDLLPQGDISDISGYEVGDVNETDGPGTLHFCTILLKIPGCDQCALSLEDLGTIDPMSGNDSQSYRDILASGNQEAEPSFQDNVVGEDSWLATMTKGDTAGISLLYFKVGDVAYDLTSPRVTGGALNADQMIKLAKVAAANAQ